MASASFARLTLLTVGFPSIALSDTIKNNYAIVSAVHGRPEVAEAWAEHLANHSTCPVVVAGDDPEIKERMRDHLEGRLVWVPYCNQPLASKWNRALEKALWCKDTWNLTHVVILGSDDFPSPHLCYIWQWLTNKGDKFKFAALHALHFHGLAANETTILSAKRSFGTARMFDIGLLQQRFDSYGYAWSPHLNKGLDSDLWINLGQPEEDVLLVPTDDLWCCALKSSTQLHSYDKLKRLLHMPVVARVPTGLAEWLQWVRPKTLITAH